MTLDPALVVTKETAVRLLQSGKVGIIPTDTVYGLAAAVGDAAAVSRLYALKSRVHKPGSIVAATVDQLQELGVSPDLLDQVRHFWPNPLGIILPLPASMNYLHQGRGDIAMRVVADPPLQAFLHQTGPLLTSSANLPDQPVSESLPQAWDYFGDRVDFYVDGGNLQGRASSTLIRLDAAGRITILRQGAVPAGLLRQL